MFAIAVMIALFTIMGAINGHQPTAADMWQVSDDMIQTIIQMDVTSPAFKNGERIPVIYTADGKDMSPPLRWSGGPEGVAEFAIICDDPDAPGNTFTHWVIYRIPGSYDRLDEGIRQEPELDNGAMQGTNSFGNTGYGGPAPPKGNPHRYIFTVYALDAKLNLPPGITKQELQEAMQGHVIGMGKLIGLYGR